MRDLTEMSQARAVKFYNLFSPTGAIVGNKNTLCSTATATKLCSTATATKLCSTARAANIGTPSLDLRPEVDWMSSVSRTSDQSCRFVSSIIPD